MNPDDSTVQTAVEAARRNLKDHNELLPTFFLGAGESLQIIGAPFGSDEQKDVIAQFIKSKAKELDADFILFVAESWTIRDQEGAKDYLANKEKYDFYMGNHPKAQEIVMFALETKTRVYSAIADILPDRELGEVKWSEPEKMEGRFSNLLGEKPVVH